MCDTETPADGVSERRVRIPADTGPRGRPSRVRSCETTGGARRFARTAVTGGGFRVAPRSVNSPRS